MSQSSSLHGDGINFDFFNLLWIKSNNQTTVSGDLRDHASNSLRGDSAQSRPILRVPDTVVFLFGQPHQWYFTSNNGGPDKSKTTILRKRRANLTVENIVDVFLSKAASKKNGNGSHDIVAYFITSSVNHMCTNEEIGENELLDSIDPSSHILGKEASCNIEYFNKTSLREFLKQRRNDKSGILQRFIAPHGGGQHNSQIRAIWTPKLCILERRRTKQNLHDKRFALYERAITFDGPDVHSLSMPLRGTVLGGKIEKICDEIVQHISQVSAQTTLTDNQVGRYSCANEVTRMIVNFKVDGNGKIWILWSNSIRLNRGYKVGRKSIESTISAFTQTRNATEPLNLDTLVKIPSSVKLTQSANHDAQLNIDNKLMTATCPSCNKSDCDDYFQHIPFKTVIQHFEKTMEMLKSKNESHPSVKWPPEDRFLKAAGNVGFGALAAQLIGCSVKNEETFVIPPVLRQIQPNLRARGYQMYRSDPLFLSKTCRVCEDCFLAYANLTTTSFIMTPPVDPLASDNECKQFGNIPTSRVSSLKSGRKCEQENTEHGTKKVESTGASCTTCIDFGDAPELPPAILEPPRTADTGNQTSNRKELGETNQNKNIPPHLIRELMANVNNMNLQHLLVGAKKGSRKKRPTTMNPYEEDLERLLI
ncbi:hypothetical protein ACHAXS_009393 [Conticribra weissflogii]